MSNFWVVCDRKGRFFRGVDPDQVGRFYWVDHPGQAFRFDRSGVKDLFRMLRKMPWVRWLVLDAYPVFESEKAFYLGSAKISLHRKNARGVVWHLSQEIDWP